MCGWGEGATGWAHLHSRRGVPFTSKKGRTPPPPTRKYTTQYSTLVEKENPDAEDKDTISTEHNSGGLFLEFHYLGLGAEGRERWHVSWRMLPGIKSHHHECQHQAFSRRGGAWEFRCVPWGRGGGRGEGEGRGRRNILTADEGDNPPQGPGQGDGGVVDPEVLQSVLVVRLLVPYHLEGGMGDHTAA